MTVSTGKHRLIRKIGSSILALAGLGFFLVWLGGAFGAKVGPGEVHANRPSASGRDLALVKCSTVDETITAIGSVQPRRKADIASRIIASVLDVKVQPGDKVRPGDVLIVLDDRELVAQHAEAMAAVNAAEVDVDVRKRDYDRSKMLAAGAESKEEKEHTTAAYNLSQALLMRARQQVARVEVQLTYTQIMATSPGVVADRFADPGDLAVPGKPLLSIQDTRELELHVCVPESQALNVIVGQRLPLWIDSANVAGVGTVREVVPLAQQASRSVLAKVTLPVAISAPVYAGMFGRVTIPVGQTSRMLIPQTAVKQVGQLDLVEVASSDGTLERRFVRMGRAFDGKVEILSGLNEGETVALPH